MVTLPNIGLFDIGLSIVYLVIIYFIAFRYQQSKIENNPEYRYFLFGLSAKLIGSIAFVLISLYYYEKGDTFLYFQIAEDLRVHFFIDFNETLATFFTSYSGLGGLEFSPLEQYNYYYERTSSWDFGRLVFVFNFISFGSYLVSSILMGVVSFLGLWLGYSVLCELYKQATKLFLIPFFLIPTALIWSSGILKDTIIIGTIGLLIFSFSKIFIFRKGVLLNGLIIVLSIYLLLLFRPILLFVLIPSFLFWGLLYLTEPIKNKLIKVVARATIVIGIICLGWVVNQSFASETSKYRVQNLMKTLWGFQSFHSMEQFSEGQNVYTLGGIMSTPQEVIKNIPEAIVVTFFRPYLWEVNNASMFLGGVESFLILIIVIYIIVVRRKTIIKTLIYNNEVIFMMVFSLTYSFIVGVSAYNFGALSRYKVPSILFLLVGFIICYIEESNNLEKVE